MAIFEGAGVAIITPFHTDGSIDYDKFGEVIEQQIANQTCLLYTSPSPRDRTRSRMPSSA